MRFTEFIIEFQILLFILLRYSLVLAFLPDLNIGLSSNLWIDDNFDPQFDF